jgi:hypothetical protein
MEGWYLEDPTSWYMSFPWSLIIFQFILWGFHRENDFVLRKTWQYNFCIDLFLQMNPPTDLMVPFSFYFFFVNCVLCCKETRIIISQPGCNTVLLYLIGLPLCFCTAFFELNCYMICVQVTCLLLHYMPIWRWIIWLHKLYINLFHEVSYCYWPR